VTVVGALNEIVGGVHTGKAYKIFAVILLQLRLSHEGGRSCSQGFLWKAAVEMTN
jgi:hypothetical protein